MAEVEWHPGELYPRVGFIVTNQARSAEGVVAFYNQRGTCEQYIKEGKNAIKWTPPVVLQCGSNALYPGGLVLEAGMLLDPDRDISHQAPAANRGGRARQY